MKLLEPIQNKFSEKNNKIDDLHLQLLFPDSTPKTREEVIYRRNGKSVDRVIEFDIKTGSKIKTTHYDYFNDKKIRSIDEFDSVSGRKLRTINYVLYKSIDEYDLKTGKKLRTINFNVKDDSKISSIQEYDLETGKIIKISIYKKDGRSVSIIKNIDPLTEKVTNWFSKSIEYKPVDMARFTTRSYENIKKIDEKAREDVANLIDNLYQNNLRFENI